MAYVSRSLNQTEQQHAQIEKEYLAIVFSCDRFHQFISRRKVEKDHKPLEAIFKKNYLKIQENRREYFFIHKNLNLMCYLKMERKCMLPIYSLWLHTQNKTRYFSSSLY